RPGSTCRCRGAAFIRLTRWECGEPSRDGPARPRGRCRPPPDPVSPFRPVRLSSHHRTATAPDQLTKQLPTPFTPRRTPVGRLFGTDGVRGVANADLTAEMALGLSVAAAGALAPSGGRGSGRRPVAVVGRDSRASGEFLEAAVVAGLA